MSVGVMEDYKLRDLRVSHTLGRSWNTHVSTKGIFFFIIFFSWKQTQLNLTNLVFFRFYNNMMRFALAY
jgi:hypothetical protein